MNCGITVQTAEPSCSRTVNAPGTGRQQGKKPAQLSQSEPPAPKLELQELAHSQSCTSYCKSPTDCCVLTWSQVINTLLPVDHPAPEQPGNPAPATVTLTHLSFTGAPASDWHHLWELKAELLPQLDGVMAASHEETAAFKCHSLTCRWCPPCCSQGSQGNKRHREWRQHSPQITFPAPACFIPGIL